MKQFDKTDLLTIGSVVHVFMGEENWYFIVMKTGEKGFIKFA